MSVKWGEFEGISCLIIFLARCLLSEGFNVWSWLLRVWGVVSVWFLITGFHSETDGGALNMFAICAWLASDTYILWEKRKGLNKEA